MKTPIKFYKKPKLLNPCLVVGWPDAGYVGATVVTYLKDKLGAEVFCEIEPYEFSMSPEIVVKRSVIEALRFPKNEFFSWRNETSPDDLIIFRGTHPVSKAYDFANLILDVAQEFDVRRIYPVGGLLSGISHTEKPKVLAVTNKTELRTYLTDFDVEASVNYQGHPTLNGLLLGVAQKRNIEGILMVAEVPFYIARLPHPMNRYPKSSKAILLVLAEMLNLEIDLSGMERLVKRTEEQAGKLYQELYDQMIKEMGGIIYQRADAIAGTEDASELTRHRIEELFRQAERDRSKALELQRELYRLGVFEEYQDRFFNLFRKQNP